MKLPFVFILFSGTAWFNRLSEAIRKEVVKAALIGKWTVVIENEYLIEDTTTVL